MIKVNLLPVKKKKKSKPLPTFLISTVFVTLASVLILGYLVYFFSSRVSAKQAQVVQNEQKIQELKEKIKSVEDYENRKAVFQQRIGIIEQLSKNKTIPVKILNEVSALLPEGVWITSMDVTGMDISLGCTAYTNTDVVNYVNNLKNSNFFTDVYLQESVQAQITGMSAYNFRLTLKVKV